MSRNVFFSFQFDKDHWRAGQVRNIGVVEGNSEVSGNKWEEIKGAGDTAVENWINENLKDKSCLVVLIGNGTANRKWINYEIKRAWDLGKGVVGVYIHGLKNKSGDQDSKGVNPFNYIYNGSDQLSGIVKAHDSPFVTSTYVYSHISDNLSIWVEDAIKLRDDY
jgi:hypothetical protein